VPLRVRWVAEGWTYEEAEDAPLIPVVFSGFEMTKGDDEIIGGDGHWSWLTIPEKSELGQALISWGFVRIDD
jgi:hypothetical protein